MIVGEFFAKISKMIEELSLVRKLSMVIVLVVSVGVLTYMINVSNEASLEPLFTNLNSQDLGTILTRLDKQNIEYKVDQERRTILVPANKVLELRVKLAEEGLPRFGGIGFELFDKASFGMSEFEQRINLQRAMEGELSRTISNIKDVESARVHLVLPEKSLFSESQDRASASVIVKMGSNGSLPQSIVQAITHLVSSAVEGLGPNQVTIVDTQGRLLSTNNGDSKFAAGAQVFDQKLSIERNLEDRVVSLLTPVVGLGKVIARATVDIDFTQTESMDETIDPTKSAVVKESRTNSKSNESAGGGGGAAGAAGNLPGGAGGAGGSSGNSNSDQGSEEISYAVSKTTKKQITPMGKVGKLSLAIIVDGLYDEKDGKKTYKPRTDEEINKIQDLIKNAIGYNTERGDQLKVDSMEFKQPEAIMAEAQSWYQQRTTYGFIVSIVGNILVVVAFLLIYLFVIRPLMKSWKTTNSSEGGAMLTQGIDLAQLVKSNPTAAMNAIKQWVK